MSRSKGKTTRTSELRVVGVIYNENKKSRSVRLTDFLKAERDLDDSINAKAEDEEVAKLKAENNHRVEELLEKAKGIRQRSKSQNENKEDTIAEDQLEADSLEHKSDPNLEENSNDINKVELHTKAHALEQLHKMDWKRCQDDVRNISRSSNGSLEFLPVKISKKDDEYFSGTKQKKNRERKKNKEEILVSLEELEKCRSSADVSKKNSVPVSIRHPRLSHTIPPPSDSCWQKKAGAALFEGTETTEDAELNWALQESLREQQEEQKKFMEMLAGSYVPTNRKPSGNATFVPPKSIEEVDWDAGVSYQDTEEKIDVSKTEDRYTEVKGKKKNNGSELINAGYTKSKTCTTSINNNKLQDLYDNGEQRDADGEGHFIRVQQVNKLSTNLSKKSEQKEAQNSRMNRSCAPSSQISRKQTHLDRPYLQHDNKGEFEGGTEYCIQRVAESLESKSDTVQRPKDIMKSVMQSTDCESLNRVKTNPVCRNILDIPPASSNTRKDDGLTPKMVSLKHTSKHISQSEVKNISQSFSALHIEAGPMGSWEEEKLTHQNSEVANEVQLGAHESFSSLSPNKVSHFPAETQESNTANVQHLTQARESQNQPLSSFAVSQNTCSTFKSQEVSASLEHHKQQKQEDQNQQFSGSAVSQTTCSTFNSQAVSALVEHYQQKKQHQSQHFFGSAGPQNTCSTFNPQGGNVSVEHYQQQKQEHQNQQFFGSAVPQNTCSTFNPLGVSASVDHYQQHKQPLPSQNVPGQSVNRESCESLLEELQRIKLYQNLLVQLSAQERFNMALQQELQLMRSLGISCSTLTKEQQQTLFQMQHQQTLVPDVIALLQQQIQNAPTCAPFANLLPPQYSGAALPNPKDTSQHSQTPSTSLGSPDSIYFQKLLQGMLQQQDHQQQLNAFLHPGFPGANVTDEGLKQQGANMTQPGTQASTTVHLSSQTSYTNVPHSDFVGSTQYPHPMLLQQQYAPSMHAQLPSMQGLTQLAHMNPTVTNTAMPAMETTGYQQSMLLQQHYAPKMLASPRSLENLTGASSNMNPTAMSAEEIMQYQQFMLLQQQYALSMLSSPKLPETLTGASSNVNPTATSAEEIMQYQHSMLPQQQYTLNMLSRPKSPESLTGASSNVKPTPMSAEEITQHSKSMLLEQQYAPNILTSPCSSQTLTGALSNTNAPAANIGMSAVEKQYDTTAQLMRVDIHNQQPVGHKMAGVAPLLPQEKRKSKGRCRILREME